jgi:hypothetical protein
MFVQMAEGVDEDTWRYHLDRGDITRWFKDCVKDRGLADAARRLEDRQDLPASETRLRIAAAIEERFTLPA